MKELVLPTARPHDGGWREVAYASMASRDWRPIESCIAACVAGDLRYLPGTTEEPLPPLSTSALRQQRQRQQRKRHTWRMRLAYYGPSFSGFAWQNDAPLPTVAGCLQEAIEPLLEGRHSLVLSCAGRTDAGVSALGQQVSFYAWPELTPDAIRDAVARASPQPGALRVVSAREVDRSYHATFSTAWRRYAYLLPPPPGATSSREEVAAEAEALDGLLRGLAGTTRDYAALGRGLPKNKPTQSLLRHAAARPVALPGGGGYATRVDLVGDRFIRRQVRVLVATGVAAVAAGQPSATFIDACTSGQQERTAHPAPPQGLVLHDAGTDEDAWLPL